MNTNLSGNAAVYYFPNSPFASNEGHTIFSNMTVIVFILFLFSFLNLKNKAPFLYKVGLILIINSVISILIYPFSSYRFLFTYGIVINLPLMMVYSLITTFYLVKLRYRPAYFLFFGGLFVFFWYRDKFNCRVKLFNSLELFHNKWPLPGNDHFSNDFDTRFSRSF